MELAFLFLWALCEPIRIFLGAFSRLDYSYYTMLDLSGD